MSTTTISTSSSSSEDATCLADNVKGRIKIKSRSSSRSTPTRLRLVETMLTSKPSLTNKLFRAVILFLLGSALAFVLNMLQMEYKANLFPNTVIFFFQHNWFFIPLCGLAATYIGTCYSIIDKIFGQIQPVNPDWTVIIRCFALFIGLNHLVAKIHFENASHFSMILITFCVVFWYWFDKTKSGLVFNILNAVCIIIAAHMVRYFGIFNYTNIQFDYLQTCLACFVFSGGVTFGNIGRILELYDLSDLVKGGGHEHSD